MKKLIDRLSYRVPLLSTITTVSLLSTQYNSLSPYKPLLLDIFKSSSIILSLPFSVGDLVSINNTRGRVSDVSLRYISLDNKESVTYIPTHLLYGSIITKYK